MIADGLTISRMAFSALLLVFSPSAAAFWAFYLLCGATDVLDGVAARRLRTGSRRGAALDSAADLLFAAVCAVRLLPLLRIPAWIWIWTAAIGAGKLAAILRNSRKARRLTVAHSAANRLTGVLLFLLPVLAQAVDVRYAAIPVCAAATAAAAEEFRTGGRDPHEQI